MKLSAKTASAALRITLAAYIALCVLIAGLNYGLAPSTSPAVASAIHSLYAFYENEFKVGLILVCSLLTFIADKNAKRSRLRRANVIGLCAAAIVVHVIIPLLVDNRETYYVVMPLPWSSVGLQLLDPTSPFYQHKAGLWGMAGLSATVIVFSAVNAFIFVSTMLFGRRLQCSTLCLMNGFVAEIWSPVLPLARRRREPNAVKPNTSHHKRVPYALKVARVVMFAVSVSFTLWWILKAAGAPVPFSSHSSAIAQIETIKYLTLELLVGMFFWVAWSGRGYCHYCPAGTALALVARLGGQRIRTDLAPCVGCGLCSKACPLAIDIAAAAARSESVTSLSCVGCGHCVDACRSGVLAYETRFLRLVRRIRGSRIRNS